MIFDATPDGKLTQVFPTAASLRSPTGGIETTRLTPAQQMLVPNYRNPYRGFDVYITEPRGEGAIVAVLSEQPLKSLDTPKSMKVYDKASGLALVSRLHDELKTRMQSARDDAHPPYSMAVRKYTIQLKGAHCAQFARGTALSQSRAQNRKAKGDGHEHSCSHFIARPCRRCGESRPAARGPTRSPTRCADWRHRKSLDELEPERLPLENRRRNVRRAGRVALASRSVLSRQQDANVSDLRRVAVAPTWVLTAASCFTGSSVQPQDWTVVSDVKKAPVLEVPKDATSRAVKRIIVHEDYNDKTAANDIALVELASSVSAKPIALQLTADPAVEENHDVTIAGWGYTRGVKRKTDGQGHPINDDQGHPIFVDTETGERVDPLKVFSPDLRKATMALVPTAECASAWEGAGSSIDQRTLCAAQPEGGVGECMGDYGGPAAVKNGSGEWRQVGISSWGPLACGLKGYPSVFTRVSAFGDWIQQKMGGKPSGSAAWAMGSRPPAGETAGDNPAGLNITFDKGDVVTVGDVVSFVATAQQSGYLTIFDVGPDGKLTQVFPNAASLRSPSGATGATRLDPTQPVVVPDYRNPNHGFAIRISEPRGEATMAAILTDRPLSSVDTPSAPKTFEGYDGLSLLSRIRAELAGRMRSGGDSDHAPWSIAVRKYTIR